MLALDAFDLDSQEIERRFRQARRGTPPGWLWPDLSPDQWRHAVESIAAASRQALAGGAAPARLDGDPIALCVGGYTSGMGPLVGHWLETGRIAADEGVAKLFALQLRHNRLRMQRLADEAARAIGLLDQAGIGVTLLKGMHTAHAGFPEPGARSCSDIDLYVAPGAWREAERCLEAEGYRPGPGSTARMRRTWQPDHAPRQVKSLLFVHCDDPWSIDLQGTLDRAFAPGAVARLQDLAAASPPGGWAPCERAQLLRQPLLTLYLAAHASQGLASLTLIRLVELVLVIRRDTAAGHLDWGEFQEVAERTDALGFAYPAFRFVEEIAPGTVPPELLAACAAAAPPAVRRHLAGFSAATVHRVDRWSFREAFMWCDGWPSRLRQLGRFLAPPVRPGSVREVARFYRWRLRCAIAAVAGR